MRNRNPMVYILASGRHGTIYIGVTSDLEQRLHQHREGTVPGFASQHGVDRVVHIEQFETMIDAIAREKQLKNWRRDWKVALIEQVNPFWEDLAVHWGWEPIDRA